MQTESNIRPHQSFEIENINNGKCDIVIYDNIQEIIETDNEINEKKYVYDLYRIKTNYREEMQKNINDNFQSWLNLAKQQEYDKLAEKVRAKRNELLKETDSNMCIDRLGLDIPNNITAITLLNTVKNVFTVLREMKNGNMATYRQQLRDITEQEGFPYNVIFPNKPE